MSIRSHQLLPIVAGCLAAIAAGGCQSPWTAAPSFTRVGAADHAAASHDSAVKAPIRLPVDSTATNSPTSIPVSSKSGGTDAAMVDVMQEVQRVGATDPAAQKMLLDQLQRSKPEMWPLVVQHFQSSLNYHDQLAAKHVDNLATTVGTAANGAGRVSTNGAQVPAALAVTPPSDRIGELADPRGVRTDALAEQALAIATPANMPAPFDREAMALAASLSKAPQPLAMDPTARPLVPANPTAQKAGLPIPPGNAVVPAADPSNQAKQALYEAQVGGASGVKQALATSPIDQSNARGAAPASSSGISSTDVGTQEWRQHVDQAIKDLEQRLPEAPQTTAEVHQQVSLRLLELLAGRTEDALKPIPQISHEEQDYWSGQIYALATYLDHHSQPDDKRRAAASVAHLDEAVGHLRELGSLSLRNLTFCKNVYDYGCYEPYDDPQFSPGQQVTLYVEVENYHSDSTDKGFCTSLGTSYEIIDDHGKRLEGGDFPDVEDCCRSRRRDFHIQYGLAISKKLAPGKYRLDLDMKDRRGDKLGHASIDFEIRGGKS